MLKRFRFGGQDLITNPNPNIIRLAKITNPNLNIRDLQFVGKDLNPNPNLNIRYNTATYVNHVKSM